MHALLHVEQQLRIGRLGPEVLHDPHRLQELRSKWRALREARSLDNCLERRVATEFPPLLLYRRLREPLDVLQRIFLVIRRRHHRDALATELGEMALRPRWIDKEADLVTTDIRVLIEAREEGEPVH